MFAKHPPLLISFVQRLCSRLGGVLPLFTALRLAAHEITAHSPRDYGSQPASQFPNSSNCIYTTKPPLKSDGSLYLGLETTQRAIKVVILSANSPFDTAKIGIISDICKFSSSENKEKCFFFVESRENSLKSK